MYYPDVPALDPEDIELLCNEYIAHNKHLDPHIADRLGVKRGLRNPDGTGVLAGITNVSSVIGYEKLPEGTIRPIPGRLVYRGIDIDTLAAEADKNDRFMFEEVVWLLLFGALPTQEQYARFCKLIDEHRELPKGFADDMIMNSPSPNIMNKMARSVLSMYSYDEHADDLSLPNILTQSINLIAELPTMMVNAYQLKRRVYDHESMYFHYPIAGQSTAEHILSSYRADQSRRQQWGQHQCRQNGPRRFRKAGYQRSHGTLGPAAGGAGKRHRNSQSLRDIVQGNRQCRARPQLRVRDVGQQGQDALRQVMQQQGCPRYQRSPHGRALGAGAKTVGQCILVRQSTGQQPGCQHTTQQQCRSRSPTAKG